MYFIISLIVNLAAAIFAGVQFGRVAKVIKGTRDKAEVHLSIASGLGAFAVPFYSPVNNKLEASVSFFHCSMCHNDSFLWPFHKIVVSDNLLYLE